MDLELPRNRMLERRHSLTLERRHSRTMEGKLWRSMGLDLPRKRTLELHPNRTRRHMDLGLPSQLDGKSCAPKMEEMRFTTSIRRPVRPRGRGPVPPPHMRIYFNGLRRWLPRNLTPARRHKHTVERTKCSMAMAPRRNHTLEPRRCRTVERRWRRSMDLDLRKGTLARGRLSLRLGTRTSPSC